MLTAHAQCGSTACPGREPNKLQCRFQIIVPERIGSEKEYMWHWFARMRIIVRFVASKFKGQSRAIVF